MSPSKPVAQRPASKKPTSAKKVPSHSWRKNSTKDLKTEYKFEYLNHIRHEVPKTRKRVHSITERDFLKSGNFKVVRMSAKQFGSMGNTFGYPLPSTVAKVKSRVSKYPRWGSDFHNETTFNALVDAMRRGDPISMPIALRQGKWIRIMSGNTRGSIAFAQGASSVPVQVYDV